MKKVGFVSLVMLIIVAMGFCTCAGTYTFTAFYLSVADATKIGGESVATLASLAIWILLWIIFSTLLIRRTYRKLFKK